MAPDTQHIRKKFNPLFIHVIAWTIIFLFPLLFFERFESMRRMHDFNLLKFYIQPLCIALIFYINYLWLIDKVLFQKKPIRFIIYNLLLIVLTNIISFLVHRMMVPPEVIHWRSGIIPPPRPGLMQWQDAITLALSVGLSVAIKMTQKWIISEKERKGARAVYDARFELLEKRLFFVFFRHHFLPRCGGTLMVTPLGANRKILLVICCMDPLSAYIAPLMKSSMR